MEETEVELGLTLVDGEIQFVPLATHVNQIVDGPAKATLKLSENIVLGDD